MTQNRTTISTALKADGTRIAYAVNAEGTESGLGWSKRGTEFAVLHALYAARCGGSGELRPLYATEGGFLVNPTLDDVARAMEEP